VGSKGMEEMDRRTFVKTVAGTLAAPTVSSLSAQAADTGSVRRKTRPPNVIIMICDDLGSGDLHCYGSSLQTPNLDRMAQEGVRFTHFNTAHPLCSAYRDHGEAIADGSRPHVERLQRMGGMNGH
jgi:arylsulfatase A